MKVSDVMTCEVECIPPNASLKEAAAKMKELDVGSLPVCDNDRLVGMITDRDITVRSVSDGHDPQRDRVRDTMTPEVIWCFDDADVSEAANKMRDKQIRR